jgi:hypothetical protein
MLYLCESWAHLIFSITMRGLTKGTAMLAGSDGPGRGAASKHSHVRRHEEMWHIHSHRHDGGMHDRPPAEPVAGGRRTRWHRREPVPHEHPQLPDLHHVTTLAIEVDDILHPTHRERRLPCPAFPAADSSR